MFKKYIERNFKPETVRIIDAANEIIREYQALGYTLTLRQLYYQFVSRDLIPNKQSEYKRLGSIVNDARLAGLMDWAAIEDRTRNLETINAWESPAQLLEACADQDQEDLWRDQPVRVEVWLEKEALVGVIERVCQELRVPYIACRGYLSQSEAFTAGQRVLKTSRHGQRTIVLHLGDHDPSGIDMTRDNRDRLRLFSESVGRRFELIRVALNRDQIDEYNPPPNPAKETDARFAGYAEEHGDESFELDALPPDAIGDEIRRHVLTWRDQTLWDSAGEEEVVNRDRLLELSRDWS